MRASWRIAATLCCTLAVAAMRPPPVDAQPACRFALGFASIADRLPERVGRCLEDEHFDPSTGNALQRTTAHHGQGGLLVWRKADNWTAFTDGHRTWVNGPDGQRERLNAERFCWEADASSVGGCSESVILLGAGDTVAQAVVRRANLETWVLDLESGCTSHSRFAGQSVTVASNGGFAAPGASFVLPASAGACRIVRSALVRYL